MSVSQPNKQLYLAAVKHLSPCAAAYRNSHNHAHILPFEINWNRSLATFMESFLYTIILSSRLSWKTTDGPFSQDLQLNVLTCKFNIAKYKSGVAYSYPKTCKTKSCRDYCDVTMTRWKNVPSHGITLNFCQIICSVLMSQNKSICLNTTMYYLSTKYFPLFFMPIGVNVHGQNPYRWSF